MYVVVQVVLHEAITLLDACVAEALVAASALPRCGVTHTFGMTVVASACAALAWKVSQIGPPRCRCWHERRTPGLFSSTVIANQ